MLAGLGYTVTGVDLSDVGVGQMLEKANSKGIRLTGIVEDLYSFEIKKKYDVILLDSMLHFEDEEREREKKLVLKIADAVKINGLFCNCMLKSSVNEKLLKRLLDRSRYDWKVMNESYIEFPEFDAVHHLYIVKKKGYPLTDNE